MSWGSFKPSTKSSGGSGVSQNRSISDIIESLQSSFLKDDYRAAVKELTDRENRLKAEKKEVVDGLKERNDFLEGELRELKKLKYELEEERGRFKRAFDVNEDTLRDLTRDLSLAKEKEKMAMKRYDRLHDSVREMEAEKSKLISDLSCVYDTVEELKKSLSEKEGKIEELVIKNDDLVGELEKLEGLRKKNACLEEEVLKFTASLEELNRKVDERMEDLVKKNELERRQLEAKFKAQLEELEEIKKQNAILEEQKTKYDANIKELKRDDAEKDKRIEKLSEDIALMKRDIIESMEVQDKKIEDFEKMNEALETEKRELTTKLVLVEEKFTKLEGDVISCLCLEVGRNEKFSSSQIGKILSHVIKVLDSEEIGPTCKGEVEKDGNTQAAELGFVSRVNEMNSSLKSDKQPLEDVQKKLDFDSNDVTGSGNKRTTSADPIIIDSDDDYENPNHVHDVKNKRRCRRGSNNCYNLDSSSDDSLKQTLETKKFKPALCEQVKLEPSVTALLASRNDHKINNLSRQTLPTTNKSEEIEVTGPRPCSSSKYEMKSNDCKSKYGTPDAVKSLSPQVEELMSTLRRRKQNKIMECYADMVCAFDNDDDLCAKAVCALYRLHNPLFPGTAASVFVGTNTFQKCDSERVTTIAKFLIDGDPNGKMTRSVADLQKHDRVECKRLAAKYSKQLFDIYKKRYDPHFSPLSTDLLYKSTSATGRVC